MNRESDTMSDVKKALERIKNSNKKNTSASQGLDLPQPEIKQLHPAKYQLEHVDDAEIQDFFLLVTQVDEKQRICEVIPGSFEGLMAGPDDIVLPESVLGQWAYLSLDMVTTVPISSLGNGFAKLDDHSFALVQKAIGEYRQDSSYRKLSLHRAMPYISDHDDRIEYHNKQKELLAKLKFSGFKVKKFPFAPPFKHFYKVASVLFVGALVTFSYVVLRNTLCHSILPTHHRLTFSYAVLRNTPEEQVPTGTLRGMAATAQVFSPQGALYTNTPQVAIGGSAGKSFEVTLRDMQKNIIAQKTISSGEIYQWEDFTGKPECLKENEIYSIQVKSENHIVQKTFFLLEQTERKRIASLIDKKTKAALAEKIGSFLVGITANSTIAAANKSSPLKQQETEYETAKILFEQGCYSEAYIKAKLLLDFEKNNEEYKKLYAECLKKLGIKPGQFQKK